MVELLHLVLRVVCRRASTLLISSLFWERLPVMGAWILWRCWGWNMWLGYLSAEEHASDTWYLYWVEKPKNKTTCKKTRESGHVYFDCEYDMMSTPIFPCQFIESFDVAVIWIASNLNLCTLLQASWNLLKHSRAFASISKHNESNRWVYKSVIISVWKFMLCMLTVASCNSQAFPSTSKTFQISTNISEDASSIMRVVIVNLNQLLPSFETFKPVSNSWGVSELQIS